MTTTALVNGIKNKDEEVFESFYGEYKDIVYYVIYQILQDKEASKEMTQDTFLTIYNKIDQYNGGNVKYWIIQIAKNLAKNYYTRVQAKEKNCINNDEIVYHLEERKSYNSFGKFDDVLNSFCTNQEKDIIVYHLVFQYSFSEIASIINISRKEVSKKYHLLLKVLKFKMKELSKNEQTK